MEGIVVQAGSWGENLAESRRPPAGGNQLLYGGPLCGWPQLLVQRTRACWRWWAERVVYFNGWLILLDLKSFNLKFKCGRCGWIHNSFRKHSKYIFMAKKTYFLNCSKQIVRQNVGAGSKKLPVLCKLNIMCFFIIIFVCSFMKILSWNKSY